MGKVFIPLKILDFRFLGLIIASLAFVSETTGSSAFLKENR